MRTSEWLRLLLVGLVLYGIGRLDAGGAADDTELNERVAHDVRQSRAARAAYATLQADSVIQEMQKRELRRQVVTAKAGADTAARGVAEERTHLATVTSTSDSLYYAMRGWMQAEIRGDRLQVALDAAMSGWDAERVEKDRWKGIAGGLLAANLSLDGTLAAVNAARRCYLVDVGPLEIGCPSRKLTAVLSLVGGMAIGYKLAK